MANVRSYVGKILNLSIFGRKKIPFLRTVYPFFLCKDLKSKKTILSFIFSSLFTGFVIDNALPKSGSSQSVIKVADSLYDEGNFEELYCVLEKHRSTNDPEILWRLARAIFEKCRSIKEDKEKLTRYEEALKLVDDALQINENCWAAHKWRAILLDYVWRYKSTKDRIIHSFDIKKHMERAVELNPRDATSYYLIGEWCFTFAEMPWYQRKVAAAIFASPPTSTYEEALEYFVKAEKVSPYFYSMNLLMIGKCLLRTNEKQKAVIFLKKVQEYPIKTADDQKAHDEAVKLLKDL